MRGFTVGAFVGSRWQSLIFRGPRVGIQLLESVGWAGEQMSE